MSAALVRKWCMGFICLFAWTTLPLSSTQNFLVQTSLCVNLAWDLLICVLIWTTLSVCNPAQIDLITTLSAGKCTECWHLWFYLWDTILFLHVHLWLMLNSCCVYHWSTSVWTIMHVMNALNAEPSNSNLIYKPHACSLWSILTDIH